MGAYETAVVVGFFVLLPVERVLAFDVAGSTVRPAMFFMGLFLVASLRFIPAGLGAMPTAVLVLAAVAIATAVSYDVVRSLGYAAWAALTIAFALAASGRLRGSEERFRAWLELYCVTAAGWGLVAIGQWFLSFAHADLAYSWFGSLPRLHALAYETSFFAFYLVPPLFLTLAARRRVWAVPILLALVLSTSRAGAIGVLVGGVVLVALAGRAARLDVVRGVALAAVGLIALVVPVGLDHQPIGTVAGAVSPMAAEAGEKLDAPYDDFVGLRDEASAAPRLASWRNDWRTFKQAPLLGVGPGAHGAYLHARGEGLDQPASAIKGTNLWLESGVELGILGLLALFVWAFAPLPFLWRERRCGAFAVPLLAALLASSAMLAFTQTWWVPYRWVPWIFAYALVGPMLLGAVRARWARRAGPFRSR